MNENTTKATCLKASILDALLAKDTSTMSVNELKDYASAVSSASSITTETMTDILNGIVQNNPYSPSNITDKNEKKEKLPSIDSLEDTVDLMLSDDYKDRLKAEYWQVSLRLESLDNHTKEMERSLSFNTLPEYELLKEQASYMERYLDVLSKRCCNENVHLFDQNYCWLCSPELVEKYSKGDKNA